MAAGPRDKTLPLDPPAPPQGLGPPRLALGGPTPARLSLAHGVPERDHARRQVEATPDLGLQQAVGQWNMQQPGGDGEEQG